MDKFYSQHGEDSILNEVFKNQKTGVYIEIGCIDGKRFSNSYYFERIKWHGLCIEAHSDYIELLKRNRPKSKVIHCAVGEKNLDDVLFYANSRGSLSTLDKSNESRWKKKFKKYFTGFEKQHVRLRTLTSICEIEKLLQIDFISIDIEGNEYKVLQGINFDLLQPKVFVIECDTKKEEYKIDTILLKNSYKKLLRINTNLIYTLDLLDIKIGKINFQLCHTLHPLDMGSDLITEKELCLRKNHKFDNNREPRYIVC